MKQRYRITQLDKDDRTAALFHQRNDDLWTGVVFHEDGTVSDIMPETKEGFFELLASAIDAPTKPDWVDPE